MYVCMYVCLRSDLHLLVLHLCLGFGLELIQRLRNFNAVSPVHLQDLPVNVGLVLLCHTSQSSMLLLHVQHYHIT